MKTCFMCGLEKEDIEFGPRGPQRLDELFPYCKPCRSKRRKDERQVLKLEAFIAYGGPHCACCGEDKHLAFLAIDHINNDGNVERKQLPKGHGSHFYSLLKRRGYPSGYQVLCHNCNMAKSLLGVCPHQVQFGSSVTGNKEIIPPSANRQANAL